jgi:hypothetical protein
MSKNKKKVLAGVEGDPTYVPATKRDPKHLASKHHGLWMNEDTISKDSSETSGVYKIPNKK